jgi:Uma2 family endonuclease
MVNEAKKFATYEDILSLPEHLTGEIINGELIVMPRPGPRHARSASILGGEITGPFDIGKNNGPGGWWILFEPEIHIQSNIIVPDLAGWRKDLVPNLPTSKAYFEVVPTWVCEILSKKTAAIDRTVKLPFYYNIKVDYVWLVNPEQKTLEVYIRKPNDWKVVNFGGKQLIRAMPFDAIEIDLENLWLPDEDESP